MFSPTVLTNTWKTLCRFDKGFGAYYAGLQNYRIAVGYRESGNVCIASITAVPVLETPFQVQWKKKKKTACHYNGTVRVEIAQIVNLPSMTSD